MIEDAKKAPGGAFHFFEVILQVAMAFVGHDARTVVGRESVNGLRCNISTRGAAKNKPRDSAPAAASNIPMAHSILRSCNGAALQAALVVVLFVASSVNVMLLLSYFQP
jgi:hypothetical protein